MVEALLVSGVVCWLLDDVKRLMTIESLGLCLLFASVVVKLSDVKALYRFCEAVVSGCMISLLIAVSCR